MAPFGNKRAKLESPGPTKKLFTREPYNFKYLRKPTLTVKAPECGESGSIGNLNKAGHDSEASSAEYFPSLTWEFSNNEELDPNRGRENMVKEWLIIVQDLDGMNTFLSTPPLNGVLYGIPTSTRNVQASDLVKVKKGKLERVMVAQRDLVGGFKYGETSKGVWVAPKSLHRIHFQVMALSKSVDTTELSEHPTKESFRGAVEGKVLAWGEWIGIVGK